MSTTLIFTCANPAGETEFSVYAAPTGGLRFVVNEGEARAETTLPPENAQHFLDTVRRLMRFDKPS